MQNKDLSKVTYYTEWDSRRPPFQEENARETTYVYNTVHNQIESISGSGKLKFCHYLRCFAIFKNVVHSFEPGETPSNSASHRAPNYAQCP